MNTATNTTNDLSLSTVNGLLSIIADVEAGMHSGPGAEQDGALAVSILENEGYDVAGLFAAQQSGALRLFFH